MAPCSAPGRAAGDERGVAAGLDAVAAGLEADQRARSVSSRNGWKMPIALEPPPTQATTASGRRPYAVEHCVAGLERR